MRTEKVPLFGDGYDCMPFWECPLTCMTTYSGCHRGAVCCNLRKMKSCALAGGICKKHCELENTQAHCPGRLKCCVYVDR
uniref:Putative carboxypeptidase inhibitor n=1 Tax=Rhipicephalus microplus TaxID=6941 RepID=A0A6G5A7A7_RHIMP